MPYAKKTNNNGYLITMSYLIFANYTSSSSSSSSGRDKFLNIQSFENDLMKDLITMDTNVMKPVIISVCESIKRQKNNNKSFRVQLSSSSSSLPSSSLSSSSSSSLPSSLPS
jgi:hypothetical protein